MVNQKKVQVRSLEKKVLVFRSNIDTIEWAEIICNQLLKMEGVIEATMDLEDSENILRLEMYQGLRSSAIEKNIFKFGFECSELE